MRETLGITNEFWLKLYIQNGKIIAEPVEKEKNKAEYAKRMLSIKGKWFSEEEHKKIREGIEEKLRKYSP